MPRLLTIPEACERLRISRASLYKLIKRGMLSLVKVGGKSVIPEDALLKLIGTSQGRASEEDAWGLYYEELLRLGLTPRKAARPLWLQGSPTSLPSTSPASRPPS